jgi:hypothetical protein
MTVPIRLHTVAICVDQANKNGISGKLYHCFREDGSPFGSLVELIEKMERLFDGIGYPQTNMRSRSFLAGADKEEVDLPTAKRDADTLQRERGERITLLVTLESRINATWQGMVYCPESDSTEEFSSAIALLDIMVRELEKTK